MEPIRDDIEIVRKRLDSDRKHWERDHDWGASEHDDALAALDRLVAEHDRLIEGSKLDNDALVAVVLERDRLLAGIGALVEKWRALGKKNVSAHWYERAVELERMAREALTKTTEDR
jgi:hypothetical protein